LAIKLPLSSFLASLSILAIALSTSGCLDDSDTTSSSTSTPIEIEEATEGNGETATILEIVDGDTIKTDIGTIRIIGIDTPERGECWFNPATDSLKRLIPSGTTIALELPEGENDTDAHGRLLRYVYTDSGINIGYRQITEGYAVARYDSRDGYPAHPKEEEYHQAQTAILRDGKVLSTTCADLEEILQGNAPAAVPADGDHWWVQYPSCAALKRNTVGHPVGPFNRDDPAQAKLYDYFANQTGNRGDGEGDGLACE